MQVMNWKETLVFPPEVPISEDAHGIIMALCNDATVRLGTFGDIREQAFFRGVDWDHIRDRPAAIPIHVSSSAISFLSSEIEK